MLAQQPPDNFLVTMLYVADRGHNLLFPYTPATVIFSTRTVGALVE